MGMCQLCQVYPDQTIIKIAGVLDFTHINLRKISDEQLLSLKNAFVNGAHVCRECEERCTRRLEICNKDAIKLYRNKYAKIISDSQTEIQRRQNVKLALSK